jgi:hypothetical protein
MTVKDGFENSHGQPRRYFAFDSYGKRIASGRRHAGRRTGSVTDRESGSAVSHLNAAYGAVEQREIETAKTKSRRQLRRKSRLKIDKPEGLPDQATNLLVYACRE